MPRQPNSWIRACKQWNKDKPIYCIPRRGTPQYDEIAAIRDAIDAEERPAAAEEVVPQEQEQEQDLIELMQQFVDTYNLNSIKKENLTRDNVVAYYNEYASKKDRIQSLLDKIDDQIEFFRSLPPGLAEKSNDVNKNILRRIKAQVKKSDRA